MLKKLLFTFVACSCMTVGANAIEFDMLSSLGNGGWGSTYNSETHTITIESAWSAGGWWLGEADYTAYDEMVMEIEPLDYAVFLAVSYVEDSDKQSSATAEAGTSKIVCLLDPERKNKVQAIWLQSSEPGDIVVKAAYLQSTAPFDPDAPVDFIENPQTLTDWNYFNIVPYNFVVAQLAEGDVICMDYISENGGAYKIVNPDGWGAYPFLTQAEGYNEEYGIAPFEAGEHTVKFKLTAEDIAILNEKGMVIQGDGGTINKLYLERSATVAVNLVENSNNNSVEFFTLQGVRIAAPASGTLCIRRQGDKVEKILIR